jgi:aromatic-L-amino-acid decarboxylase
MTRETLQRAASRAAELFTEIFAGLEERRVDPGVTREAMRALFAGTLAEEGVGLDAVLDEFARNVLPHSMGTAHPLYLGLVNSSPLPAGPLADLLVSSLNNNGGAFHQSPASSAAEEEVVRAFVRLCGLGEDVSGMILPGGTFANLQGLLLARRAHFPDWAERGPATLRGAPRLYVSDVGHFCNARAAEVIGVGRSGVVRVPSRGRGAIDVAELEGRIERDRLAGDLPFAVVASAGTTGTGALDDLGALADLCARRRLWLHVDARYGGGRLSVACARWEPAGTAPDDRDELQRRIAAAVVASGRAWFGTVRHDGLTWLRFNLLNIHTREHHIDALAERIAGTARGLAEPGRPR